MTALLHADVIVGDMERALGFYVGLLGCSVADDVMLDGAVPAFYTDGACARMRLVMLRVAPGPWGAMLELMAFDGYRPPSPRGAHVSLLVDDLAAACARLAAAGIAPASDVMRVDLPNLGASRIAFVRDPDGHLIELVGMG